MCERPSIQEQCKRLYPEDQIFGPLFRHFSSNRDQVSVPLDLHSTLCTLLPNLILEDGIIYLQ